MKIALFGATGFVGTYIVDSLVEHGHEPTVLVRENAELSPEISTMSRRSTKQSTRNSQASDMEIDDTLMAGHSTHVTSSPSISTNL